MKNQKHQWYCACLLVLTVSFNVAVADLPMETAWKATKNIVVGPGGQQKTLTFPALRKRKGDVLCLAFKAYLYQPKPSGWNHYTAINLNGTQLDKLVDSGERRLLCRGDMFTSTHSGAKERPWWETSGGKPSIMTFMGPGTGEIDQIITSARGEGYQYFLDISDVANYLVIGPDERIESNKPNALSLFNTLPERFKSNMHFDNIRVGYVKRELVDKSRGAMLVEFKKGTPVATLKGDSFTLQVMQCGGMLLENQSDKYWLRSLFSYPGDEQIQYSELGIDSCTGFHTWKPEIRQNGNAVEISADNKNTSLLRTITLEGERISVRDKLSNRTDKPVGLAVRNIAGVKTMPTVGSFKLSGMENNRETDCAANPTCFVMQKNGSIGIVAQDNVYRSALELSKRNNTFVMANTLGLAGGKTYTLRWTIYPSESKKYFSLINKVRRDWGVNHSIPGPIGLFDWDIIDQKIRKTNVTMAPNTLWFEYHNGAGVSREDYKKQYDDAAARLRKIAPGIKVMPFLETNLVPLDVTKLPDAESIPVRKSDDRSHGKYGLALNKEQTAVIEKTKYADSIMRDANGNAIIDTYYPKYPYVNLMVHPEIGNYRHQNILEQINYLLNHLETADGVYFDQFVPGKGAAFGERFDKWDGTSVVLDDKGEIKQKYYSYALTGSTARAEILKTILAKDKIVMMNGQPVTRETQNLPVIRFQEMENNSFDPMDFIDKKPPIFKWQTACHLGCPMILGQRIGYEKWYRQTDLGRSLTKSIITALRNGLLYCYYTKLPKKNVGYGPVNHMFPFTPVELHEGVLIGKERIITCVSGKYTWPHEEKPQCFYFDCRGIDKAADFKMTKTENGWEVKVELSDWNEIAVIEDAK
jgi:hypothetical protein